MWTNALSDFANSVGWDGVICFPLWSRIEELWGETGNRAVGFIEVAPLICSNCIGQDEQEVYNIDIRY